MKPVLQKYDYKFWPGGKDGEANFAAGSTQAFTCNFSTRTALTLKTLVQATELTERLTAFSGHSIRLSKDDNLMAGYQGELDRISFTRTTCCWQIPAH